jgi:hypothetical protein
MDAAMLWVTLVSALAAVAAAVFGFVQANTAIKARNDARTAEGEAVKARDAAVTAQQDSAAAADRIAAVLEQQAADRRAAAERRTEPWQARAGSYRKNGNAIVLVHVGDLILKDVSMEVERPPYAVWFDPQPVPSEFKPGDSVEIYYARAAADPATSTLVVRWRWSDSENMQETRVPLTS